MYLTYISVTSFSCFFVYFSFHCYKMVATKNVVCIFPRPPTADQNDYLGGSISLVFSPEVNQVCVDITIVYSPEIEETESFIATITANGDIDDVILSPDTATVFIFDDGETSLIVGYFKHEK